MKKTFLLTLFILFLLAGCASPSAPETQPPGNMMQIGNPWKSYDSMEAAEAASGLIFPIPEKIGELYKAESFRVMNNSLMEVTYRDLTGGNSEVTVRIQPGEDQDISGVYEEPDSTETQQINGTAVTVKTTGQSRLYLISKDGYSYSLYAPNHFLGKSDATFLSYIC